MLKSEIYKPDTFLYFSYGGNLLTFRIHMHNPSAEFVSIARLDNYRLEFIKYSSFWGGPTATLVPTANAHVWGVIWRLHQEDMSKLDDQKAVEEKKYYIKYVKVLTPYMGEFTCRAYTQKIIPLPRGDNDEVPVERWPSWTYKEVIILGAKEHEVPDYYIKNLRKLKHNGEEGALRTVCLLIRYAKNEPCECRVPGRIPRKPLKLDLNKLKHYDEKKDTFLYFAYGSNMLKKRILINLPSAELLGTGRLDDHQLEFMNFSERWIGSVATIVPKDGEHVWGSIWRIHNKESEALDKQENSYFKRLVDVVTPEGFSVQCRTYQQTERAIIRERGEDLPFDKRPSKSYVECIIRGATECRIPDYYILQLKKIAHNNKTALSTMVIFLL